MDKKKVWKDKLSGGRADKKKPSDFDKKALVEGMKHEMEHTKDQKVAMEIAMDHLTEDPKYYQKLKQIEKPKDKMKKSQEDNYTFNDTKVMVSSKMQQAAEETGPKALIKYLEASINADLETIRLPKGTLKVYQIEKGVYGGFFQDEDGQVVDRFENVTIPILAKTLAVKGHYTEPSIHPYEMAASNPDMSPQAEAVEEEAHIENVVRDVVEEKMGDNSRYLRIKYGDFELEIKKSMERFVSDFKKGNTPSKVIKKALNSWVRNSKDASKFKNEQEAATALMSNWDEYSEEFSQIVHALNVTNG